MEIFVFAVIGAAILAGILHGSGISGIGALLLTALASVVPFYFSLTNTIENSANAYALAAWPALLVVYLVIVILSGLIGIMISRKSRKKS